MARAAAVDEQVPLRRFLRTHHLAIIREGMIVLPFVLLMAAREDLDAEEIDRAAWGLAFVELAAFHNSLARQQRRERRDPRAASPLPATERRVRRAPHGDRRHIMRGADGREGLRA